MRRSLHFPEIPYSLNQDAVVSTTEEPKHTLDDINDALNPDPLCAGIVYHDINRLWPEPGKIVALPAGPSALRYIY